MTRFEAQQAIQKLGHRPGDWSPIAMPGDISNGHVSCEECGMYIVLDNGEIKGEAQGALCRHMTNVQDYLKSSLHVQSNQQDLMECPIQSICGQNCKWVIDAAHRLLLEVEFTASPSINPMLIKAAVVRACEVCYFG